MQPNKHGRSQKESPIEACRSQRSKSEERRLALLPPEAFRSARNALAQSTHRMGATTAVARDPEMVYQSAFQFFGLA
jgi:hypothetical protein